MLCDCYHVIEEKPSKFSGECWATRERDRVNCEGNIELCCNKHKKPEVKSIQSQRMLFTAEMVIEANRTHKTYKSDNMLYNVAKKFFDENDGRPWPATAFETLSEIFNLQWVECADDVMTKAEAESKFNIKIIG